MFGLSGQAEIAIGVFTAVILAIASNRLHLTVAALLGTIVLLLTGVLSAQEASASINPAEATIALFFGGMVVARTLVPTGVFDYLGALAQRVIGGDGRRLLAVIIVLAAPICAFLPNATVVIMLGPLVINICNRLRLDFTQPVLLLVFIANSAGLLTLVGDPATFIVGNAIRLSFADYLSLLSAGGLLAILAVAALLPLVFRLTWRERQPERETVALPPITRPFALAACSAVLAVMIALFMFGESIDPPVSPPAVAVIGSGFVLLIAFTTKLDSVREILRDVDWETLLFFICIFVLVGALDRTGVIGALGNSMGSWLGTNLLVASLVLLFGIAVLSSVIPNIPLVVAMVPLVKQYAIGAGLATQAEMAAGYGHIPASVLPLFFAMCFGATLGGNATLLGASSNIVASGICAQAGRPISFLTFLRYGAPIALMQLVVTGLYVVLRFG
ncbi:MAG TPA: SLC13 family permease [Acetobacteraceae bacterium]|nr:SLC13 family permease [Acetobacteraceae bacterium]